MARIFALLLAAFVVFGCECARGQSSDAASPTAKSASTNKNGAKERSRKVHDALRREAIARGKAQDTAIRELLTLFSEIQADQELPNRTRQELADLLRNRLSRRGGELNRQAKRSNKNADLAAQLAAMAKAPSTSRRQAAPVGARVNAARNNAQQPADDLIELIESTVSPRTWESNGGNGTIRYFAPSQVLVIRQTGEVHDKLGDALNQLRDQ